MLEQLFGSKTRVKLLQVFFNNPQKSYYVRELARMADTQINSIRRELDNLINLQIICITEESSTKYKRANVKKSNQKKYFQANPSFLLFHDLQSLLLKSQLLLEKDFIERLKKAGNFEYLVLTGKFVNYSNVNTDILMVGKINKNKIEKIIKDFEKDFRRQINYTVMDKEEYGYRMDIIDKFLYNILEGEKMVIVDQIN